METTTIPQDLFIQDGRHLPLGGTTICTHHTDIPRSKNRITLNSNMFNFLLEGEKILHYSGRTLRITNGHILMLAGNNCLMSEKLSGSGQYRCILFFFDDTTLTGFFRKYPSLAAKAEVWQAISIADRQPVSRRPAPSREPAICFEKDAFIRNYIQSLELMLGSGRSIPAEMQLLKFEELMLYLAERYPQQLFAFQPRPPADISDLQIRTVVESNLTNPITVEEMAFLCNTSLSTFKRRFARLYGTSPNKWLLQQRMEIAASLLQDRQEKPSDVYYKVGYENHSSFTHSFKQIFGLTPSEFQHQAASSL